MQASYKGRKSTFEERELRKKAKELGIKVHPRTGAARLKEMINEHLQTMIETPQETLNGSISPSQTPTYPGVPDYSEKPSQGLPRASDASVEYMTQEEYERRHFNEAKRNAGRLVRIRLTCMNPAKKNWTGEIISVGSAKLGTYKKFIPFNMEEPYHVPWIIYQYLKDRQCRVGHIVKLPDGREVNRYKLIPEFAVELLPPLTKKELEELKQRQAMANGQAA